MKRYDRVWLSEEDKRLAKSQASLHGMQLSDYIGMTIREKANKMHHEMDDVMEKARKKGVRYNGLFK